jgi:dimethylargininase
MDYSTAIVRLPGENFDEGITSGELGAPDYSKMLDQHKTYVQALRSLGLDVIVLDPLPEFPDAYFVEDPAVVIPEAAIITHPGAHARRGEAEAIEPVLARYKPVARIQAPGTLDGGDVLMAERHFFIGLSERTNQEGAEQLGGILAGYGYTWQTMPVKPGRLHLKSSAAWLGGERLLVSPYLAESGAFRGYERMERAPEEKYATNVLLINGTLLVPAGFPKTRAKLEALGFPIMEIDNSEARKMDGALSCLSLRF